MIADPISVPQLVGIRAAERPGALAVIDGATTYTYAELDAAVSAAARALLARGLVRGDRVVLAMRNTHEFVVLYLAVVRAGLVVVPVNPAYTPNEVEFVVRDSGAVLVVGSSAPGSVPGSGPGSGPVSVAELLAGGVTGELPTPDGSELAVLLYTSGTSGRPKGAMLTSAAMIANLEQVAALEPRTVTATDRVFIPVPLFHVFGLNGGLGVALHAGATAVLADRFEAGPTLEAMAGAEVTAVLGVPTMFRAWAADPGFARGFASVRFAWSGSAPLKADLVDAYAQAGIPLYEGYGLTETAPVVSINWSAAGPSAGSVGHPLPGVEVELRDTNGAPVRPKDLGALFVRGPNLFSGYWPDGADGPAADGWFATGDLAYRDDGGALHLVGRSTDLVIVNGFNVYPAEVESVLRRLPGVAEVAVIGVDDPDTGEAVVAYVVPVEGVELDPAALIAAAAASLARFKLPRRIEVVGALPYTVTGKVMKWRLRGAHGAS
jgi:long-chain acyl-CoA synthetase